MSSRETPQATEAATLIAALVGDRAVFSDAAAAILRRLVGHTLAAPPRAALRWDSLSLLAALIAEFDGRLPTVAEYDSARASRSLDVASSGALIARYGAWLRALTVASKLVRREGLYRGPEHTAPKPRYRAIESAAAVAQFQRAFGTWPAYEEYREWARLSRDAARACGAPHPRLPDGPTVMRHYGTFDRAVAAAKQTYGDDRGGRSQKEKNERR
jgi:hypothetical protein